MIRFAWRQARSQTLIAFGALAAAAIALVVTGVRLANVYDKVIGPCSAAGCSDSTINNFLTNQHTLWIWLGIVVAVVPGLLGIFWGAPLVAREIETGTYRLVWTQSVSRTRWIATRLGLGLVASMTVAAVSSAMVTWWAHPLDRVRLDAFGAFDERNIVPIGYAALAFVLGVVAGVLIRRTLPAIGAVVVGFTALRLSINTWIRPSLLSPSHISTALDGGRIGFGSTDGGPMTLFPESPPLPNAWVYSTNIVDAAGHPITRAAVTSACPTLGVDLPRPGPVPAGGAVRVQAPDDAKNALHTCVDKLSATYHTLTTYQPANHYWPLQWLELAVYVGAALALAAGCIWWIRHRLA